MAVAKSNGSSESSIKACNYYKVAGLCEAILGAEQISNLKDRYALGEQLGWGQFGVIRACSHKLTGELLACKSIAKDKLVTSDDVRSVKLEIEIMTRLSGHPNVVDLKEVYEEDNYVHLVMELCAGGELFHLLEEHGRFSEAEARVLFRHLMQVVLYCHLKGVVHRDLKPENILLATKAPSSPIKLADFGLATYIEPGQSLHGTVGSPFYIAPEVLSGGYNQSADIWSAGVILYILLSGMPPFWGKTKSRIFDAVRMADLRFPSSPWDCISASAKALIKGMLCVDPSQRFTAQEVLEHSWIDDHGPNVEVLNLWERRTSGGFDDLGVSLSATYMPRDQDISFGHRTHITCEAQSPTFTCGSSFSSFFPEPPTPPLASGGISFRSCGSSGALEFSSPIPSMPSFSFFGHGLMNGQGSAPSGLLSDASADGEAGSGKLFTLPTSSLIIFNHLAGEEEHKIAEVKRGGGTTEHRVLGIHSKRNRTIGLGEREQLDLVVTESVIRWSSCTLIPASLRSSLVC